MLFQYTSYKITFEKENKMFDVKFTPEIQNTDLTILLFFEGENNPSYYQDLDKKTNGLISKFLVDKKLFDAKFCKTKNITYVENDELKYVILVGLGKEEEFQAYQLVEIGGKIYSTANCLKAQSVSVKGDLNFKKFNPAEGQVGAFIAGGAYLASYRFDKYKTDKKDENKPALKKLYITPPELVGAEKRYKEVESILSGIFLARDVISEPGNVLYPESYANIIKEELTAVGVKVSILGESEMRDLGMGALLGVGQGSAKESKLVVMEYYGAESKSEAPIAFVGKGVTFDSGGISIKPSAGMGDMKYDMAGSAAVVGAIKTIALRKGRANVVGVVGLVENMPGGNAQRPGDVVKTMSGKTAEVVDTDAEGRLVLADALWYTQDKFKPKIMVNLATLTGAIVVALGSSYAGMFSNNDALVENLTKTGLKVNEKLWRMPLHKDYEEMIKSDIADVSNLGNVRGSAGSATAAHFLQHFVNDTAWAHLDIAGMAWDKKGTHITPKGAVGFGVRLLNQLVKDCYEPK